MLVGSGALALLTLLLFSPLLSPGSALYYRDLSQNHIPYRALTVAMHEAGEPPLWNPMRGNGQPLLANPNALVLHPTTLFFFFLPLHWAVKASVIGQIWLAAVGTWLLLRDLGVRSRAALFGAAVFGFSGYLISLGNLLNLLDSAAFMPLTLWAAGRAASRGVSLWGALAALSLAVQILAGEPAMLLSTLAALAALHFSPREDRDPSLPERPLVVRAAALGLVVLLAAALALAGLLPAAELLSRSERGLGFDAEEAMKWSLPPAALINTALAAPFGDPTRIDPAHWWGGQLFDAGFPLILSLYLGPVALLLSGAGLVAGWRAGGSRRAEAVSLAALAGAGLALSLGRFFPPAALLLQSVPGLSSGRYPSKYFLIVIWAVALLASRGAGEEPDGVAPRRRGTLALALQSLALAAVVLSLGRVGGAALSSATSGGGEAAASALRGLWLAAAHAAAVAGIAWFLWRQPGRGARLALVGLGVADLMVAGFRLNPVADLSFYSQPPRIASALGPAGSAGRIWSRPRPTGFAFRTPPGEEAGSLRPGFLWDRMTLRNATGFAQGYRFAYDRGNERLDLLPGALFGRMLYEGKPSALTLDESARLLAVASVDRAITYADWTAPGWQELGRLEGESQPPVVMLSSAAALPRAYVVHQIEVHPDSGPAMRRLRDPSFDPRTTVILEEGRAPARPDTIFPGAEGGASPGVAAIVEDRATFVKVRATTKADGYLVLTDSFYPGWLATLDGAEASIVRANAMFRAVALPAGEHEVIFEYKPASVRAGMAGSLAALALTLMLAIPRKR